jgi:uncharacterized protein
MTLFFPDLNVWIALSVAAHVHSREAWNWLDSLPSESRLVFSRYTQIGLLRLLTNRAVMAHQTLTVQNAWRVYDRWLADPRVDFYPEPPHLDAMFREATLAFSEKAASKWIGDCYLLAYGVQSNATLATFDNALLELARRQRHSAVRPA